MTEKSAPAAIEVAAPTGEAQSQALSPTANLTDAVRGWEGKLVGKWTFKKEDAPSCPFKFGETVYWLYLPQGAFATQNGIGKVENNGQWRVAKVYGGSLAALEMIDGRAQQRFYVVRSRIESALEQSVSLDALPSSEGAAEAAMLKTKAFAGTEIGASTFYRCQAEMLSQTKESGKASGDAFIRNTFTKSLQNSEMLRVVPWAGGVELTLLHYIYDTEYNDQRCKDALTGKLRDAVNSIGLQDALVRRNAQAYGESAGEVSLIASRAQAAVQSDGCRWWTALEQ